MAMVFLGLGALCSLGSFIISIIILVSAFKESVAQGFLTLCVPCYILYFAFAKFEHEKKSMILGAWAGCIVINMICQVLATVMAAS